MSRKKNSARKGRAKETLCPFCHNLVILEDFGEFGLICPIWGNQKSKNVKNPKEDINERLLDPRDPLGYFTHFPPEDDFL